MTAPMIIWYALAAVVLCASLLHLMHFLKNLNSNNHHLKVLDHFKEEEIFYLPGDRNTNDTNLLNDAD